MNPENLLPGERIDDLMRNGLRIIQNSNLPKFNTDSILLANFPTLNNRWKVCDLCTGTGVIPLLLSTRAKKLQISAVEINPAMADMAKRSMELNQLDPEIAILQEDIRNTSLAPGSFDLVTVNPPYYMLDTGLIAKSIARAQARHQLDLTLEDAITVALNLLKDKGLLAMVYKSSGIADLLSAINSRKLAVSRMRFIHHKPSAKSSSCLIEAQKGTKSQLVVEPPLVLFQASGEYTPELQGVYYQGKSLESRAY